ncbi:TPA: DUF417 family protein, partial [Pasteurella multocida]|nr:DUF417 family protein [Pasteurella multocida]
KKLQQSDLDMIVLRLIVILLFFIFANTKWFEFEVEALKPIISASWLSFLYDLFGVYKTSYLLGIIETLAYLGLIIGFRQPKAGLLGSGLVLITALVT